MGQREWNQKYYQSHKQKYQDARVAQRIERVAQVEGFKKSHPCTVCGCSDHRCLEFHHRNPEEKDEAVAVGLKNLWSWSRLLAEIAKCDIVCANCHKIIHYEMRRRSSIG